MKRRIVSASLLVPLVMLAAAFGPAGSAAASDDGDDEAELEGVIEALPTSGLLGDWLVSGKTVHVGISTKIEMDDGPVAVGAFVEIEGVTESDGSITASKIEVEDGADDEDFGLMELHGTIESLPATLDLVGDWRVSGRTVHVTTATELDDEDGGFAVGMGVEVKGALESDGSITAAKIEADEDADDQEEGDDDDVALTGTLQMRGGTPGTWRVSQNRVRVTATTKIVRNGHRLVHGAKLRIKGLWRANGTIRATRIVVLR